MISLRIALTMAALGAAVVPATPDAVSARSASPGSAAAGPAAPSPAAVSEAVPDEYARALVDYYRAIADREYRRAYAMLSRCEIRTTSADGSVDVWQARPGYQVWLGLHQDIRALSVAGLRRHPPAESDSCPCSGDRGDANATLGIRTYCLTVEMRGNSAESTGASTRRNRCAYVVKGTDGKVRILGTAPGP